jgi:NAD(P)-dependent dehydrogenase (short-subunit alcohol dehydrogenase family)
MCRPLPDASTRTTRSLCHHPHHERRVAALHHAARAQAAVVSAFGRLGQPDDVTDVVAFAASDDARWITGQVIDATGGSVL